MLDRLLLPHVRVKNVKDTWNLSKGLLVPVILISIAFFTRSATDNF